MSKSEWPSVDPKQSFPDLEEATLKSWQENKIFEQSVERDAPAGDFVFYDGPPFATGLPHYGHILQSVIKDMIPRYKTMQGYRVPRVWGWDCHGLPVENLIEKELGLKSKQEIEELGVDTFNEACHANVMRYANDWKTFIPRMGRWVDMEHDYKTMDPAYMDSVWWVFKELWDKGLIYEGKKPMHICPRCVTPLSNFEVGLGYKDVTDLSATAKFKVVGEENTYLLAWTTTPWTLPGNMALAVNAEVEYVKVKTSPKQDFEIVELVQKKEIEELAEFIEEHLYNKENLTGSITKKEILENKEKINWFAAKQSNKIIGAISMFYKPDSIEKIQIGYLVVQSDKRNQNIGSTLLEKFYAFAREKNEHEVFADVRPEAHDFYIKNDFIKSEKKFKWRGLTLTWFSKKINTPQAQNNVWLAKNLVETVFKDQEIEILETKKGSELEGLEYEPLFDYFADLKADHPNMFTVRLDNFVTTDSGTGIVHIAPAFGEDDLNVGKRDDLPLSSHVRMDGSFVPEVTDWAGEQVKPSDDPRKTDQKIVDHLKAAGKLFESKNYKHSYPHCWRCETPLLNYATSSWFVSVEKMKEQLIANNEKVNWVPGHVKAGRFGKWLEGARDWAISRSRFWGAPLPIWRCDSESCEEITCIGSGEELEKLSGAKVPDFHKQFVDELSWDCSCGGKMKRIPEVLDCWFESGSMPYAQHATKGDTQLPANFIAEAQDQTRGWFYTLHVLGTALFDKPAFQNVICSGLILAEDGQKMSKSKMNYPDPMEIINKYGVDAMRLYLMNSPVVRGEAFRFSERGVEETLRGVLLPLWNTYSFFTTYATADGWQSTGELGKVENKLDRWILSELNILIREMTGALDRYELQEATRPLAEFMEALTNWYIRRSRRRFWKSESDADKNEAYATLLHVLTTVSKLLAPVCPFIAEEIFKGVTGNTPFEKGGQPPEAAGGISVHLASWPKVDEGRIDEALSAETKVTRKIISLGLAIRAREDHKVRQPLAKATVALPTHAELELDTIREELNVKIIEFAKNPEDIATQIVNVNARALGPRLGKKVQECIAEAKKGNFEVKEDGVHVAGEILTGEEVSVGFEGKEGLAAASESGIVVALDIELTPELEREGTARDLVRVIQDLRKAADYAVSDRIELVISGADEVIAEWGEYICTETLAELADAIDSPDQTGELEDAKISIQKQ